MDKSKLDKSEKQGIVYLIGAGPGDIELLTLKAVKYIKEADVALVDDLVGDEIKNFIKKECKISEIIEAGKREGRHKKTQDEINQLLVKLAKEGKKVARVKGGDPFVFGRGGEEAEFLAKEGVSFIVVPGISSAIAAPAYAGIPLNHRRFSPAILILTGKERESLDAKEEEGKKEKERINWEEIAKLDATIVILMGISNLERNISRLLKGGKRPDTPVAIIEKATTPDQRVVEGKLSNIVEIAKKEKVRAPAVIVIGDVVSLRDILKDYVLDF
ncbi:MAG: uroporphyrinogen-III C-methyltransferase [Archaeoglobus sp.]|nr:uroporphyrinogen-III C-methyltransferase [Archaeoglobus sp.]